jgi:hypothetical protein
MGAVRSEKRDRQDHQQGLPWQCPWPRESTARPYGPEVTVFITDELKDAVKTLAAFSNKPRVETAVDALPDDVLAVG